LSIDASQNVFGVYKNCNSLQLKDRIDLLVLKQGSRLSVQMSKHRDHARLFMSITLSGAFEEALSVLERSLTSSRCLRNGMRHYQMNLERKAESLAEPKLTPQISLLNRLAS
jgi:hypothetical protein